MKVEQVEVSKLKHPEINTRKHPEPQIKEMVRSVEMFGQTRPIVIDESNVVLAGNGLLMALQRIGTKKASVFRKTGLSDSQKKKLMLADNKIYSLGVDDPEQQFALIEQIIGPDMDLEIPGFDEDVLKAFMSTPEETDTMVTSYGNDISKPDENSNASGSFLDGQKQEAPQEDEQNQTEAAQEKTPVDTQKQLRCPHCGEMIWV